MVSTDTIRPRSNPIPSEQKIIHPCNGFILLYWIGPRSNPSDKKFTVNIIGVYRNDNQTTNQALCFQINNKTNGLMINNVRHTYFYLRWSYNHLNIFLDSVRNNTSSGQDTYEGLLDTGFIDISVTLI